MLKSLAEWAQAGTEFAAVEFGFAVPLVMALAVLAAAGLAATLFWLPRLQTTKPFTRGWLTALRVTALLLVVFLALDPQLIARKKEPTKNFVAVLYDDSRSMSLDDGDGLSRGERLQAALEQHKTDFDEELRTLFQVVEYRFGRGAERVGDPAALSFQQSETRIADAIRGAERDLEGTSLAAVVVFSDGVEQPTADDEETPSEVPVFTVGAGREQAWRDLEVANLTVTQTQFDKSPVALSVHTAAVGLAGSSAVVEVLQDGRVVTSTPLEITKDTQENQVRLEFVPLAEGWKSYTARVRLAETGPRSVLAAVENIAVPGKDMLTENNSRDFLVDNREKEYRILYFSGRPNWENKFVARALAEDEELKLSSLLRIRGPEVKFVYRGSRSSLTNPLFEGFDDPNGNAPRYDEAVFVRLGIDGDELANGYPNDSVELYGYHLIILGDIEAEFFSQGHFEATRDFVSERGGALLMMGGPHSFASGGYGGTMLEPLLPVVLPSKTDSQEVEELYNAIPSVEGFLSGMWTLDNDMDMNGRIWDEMPPLFGATTFPMTRAGSTVWARINSENGDLRNQPLFAWQRYGEGICAIMATGETWSWQMNSDKDDNRHERFWRQAARSLVKDVKEPVVPRIPQHDLTVDTLVPLSFQVRDKTYKTREGLRTTIELVQPDGEMVSLPVSESLEETGIYSTEFLPQEPGLYVANLLAQDEANEEVGRTEQALLVHPDHREFQLAQFDPAFLKGLAERREGRYFTLDELGDVAEAIPVPEGEDAITLRIHMWQWPLFYLIVVCLLCVEWFWRRKAGQP